MPILISISFLRLVIPTEGRNLLSCVQSSRIHTAQTP
jgi:hypothetical protein